MNAIETAIKDALTHPEDAKKANKAYLEFIKANFIVPIHKESKNGNPEVLYLREGTETLMPAFTNQSDFKAWALDIQDQIQLLKLSGVDLLKGLGENVSVCLNIGSPFYKEFNPLELGRMKTMVLKLFKSP